MEISRRRRCIARVRVVAAGFSLVLSGNPTMADVLTLDAEIDRIAGRLEDESEQGVPVQLPAVRHTGEVVYGRFERVKRDDLRPAARAVNAAP